MGVDERGQQRAGALSDEVIYGDDFSEAQIREWHAAESEAYARLGAQDRGAYRYQYHALNKRALFRYLPEGVLGRALGLGSAYGHEFLPIAERLTHIDIVESSSRLRSAAIGSLHPRYVRPTPDNLLPFASEAYDLITSLGTLHHIPNVSTVLREMTRCCRSGGYVLVREPVISMGDWRRPRPGLTARERGIPFRPFRDVLGRLPVSVVAETLCVFPATRRVPKWFGVDPYNSRVVVSVDLRLSQWFAWNLRYHAQRWWHGFRPTCVAYVLRKT